MIRYRGVVYDVGLNFEGHGFSVEHFESILMQYDMKVIAHDLHANTLRIEVDEVRRLARAARIAAHVTGLVAFFNPWQMNLGFDETRAYYEEATRVVE